MTLPEGRDEFDSTVVLLVRRARRRRAARYRRRRIVGLATALAIVAVLVLGGLALADDDGGPQTQAVSATSTSRPTTTTAVPIGATPQATVIGSGGPDSPTTTPGAHAVCTSAGWSVEQRAATTIFATVENEGDLENSIAAGYGGVFFPKSAIGLVTNGTLKQRLATVARPPLSSTDEEGGRVQRLAVLGAIPSAREMHNLGPDQIRQLAAERGKEMADLGLRMDFAPVVDLVEEADVDGAGGIGDRSFSANAHEAVVDAEEFAAGLDAAGILPTYKHFPGHGHASGDTHKALATTPDLATLRSDDLVPYETLLAPGQPPAAVMVGHLAVPGLTGGEPASVSKPAITGLLRDELGFNGLVVTDDLGAMAGIVNRYPTVEAAVRAVAAGADMVLVPAADGDRVVQQITSAVADGRIADEQLTASANRVLRAQQADTCSDD